MSFVMILWTNLITDYSLKLMAIFVKAVLTTLPSCCIPILRRGKLFVFLEMSSQLHRCLATVPPWLYYLFRDHSSGGAQVEEELLLWNCLVGAILCAVYLLCKLYNSYTVFCDFRLALKKLFQSAVSSCISAAFVQCLQPVITFLCVRITEFLRPSNS